MFGLLTLLGGFISPFVGDIIKLFQTKQDYAHELAMAQESNRAQRDIADLNAQVDFAKADVADTVSARQAQPSYGARLLDALQGQSGWFMTGIKGALLIALSLVEMLNGLMRPYVVYEVMTAWAVVKAARIYLAYTAINNSGAHDWPTVLSGLSSAFLAAWDDHDNLVVDYVVGFLFGSRHRLQEAGKK